MKSVPYVNLSKQWQIEKSKIEPIVLEVLRSGQYILSENVNKFEQEVADYCGSRFSVALNSGTDALVLSLYSCGVSSGDEVITAPNSFIASTAVITHLGAKPVFVDVEADQSISAEKIKEKITHKTKAVLLVHLTGKPCELQPIVDLCLERNIKLIEDAAQAIGAFYKGKHLGTFGTIGCFSCHPLKNLNACGDAGFLLTEDERIYNRIKKLRNHGLRSREMSDEFGFVSRMDEIQAAILRYRIKTIEKTVNIRRHNAQVYREKLQNLPIVVPADNSNTFSAYHTFVIQTKKRDELKIFLENADIGSAIHYPIPLHLQPAFKNLGYELGDFPTAEKQAQEILSLPIHQNLNEEEIYYVTEKIEEFFKSY